MNRLNQYLKISLVGIISLGVYACSGDRQDENQTNPGENVIPSVEAVQARYGSLPLVERFSGNVRAENQVPLYPEISSRIEAVLVENGDFVKKGAVLARLNDDQLQQQLKQAEAGLRINSAQLKQTKAELSELEAQYRRTRQLADKDLSSDLELEQIEAQMTSAEADVELVEAQLDQSQSLVEERKEQLSRTIIRAPISGNIGQRNAEVGMQANTGTQLFMIGDLGNLRIEIVLTESMLNKITVGQTARVYVEDENGVQQSINAKLSRISPFLNEITRSTEAEIDLNNDSGLLRPGMFVPVDIYFGESEQATLIPVSALFSDPTTGEEGVFIATSLGSEITPVSDTNATDGPGAMTEPTPVEFKPINVIAEGRMELGVSGLESGQWIVTIGQDLLSEGRKQARVRAMSWDRIMRLQQLQREDLLDQIMDQQNDDPSNVSL